MCTLFPNFQPKYYHDEKLDGESAILFNLRFIEKYGSNHLLYYKYFPRYNEPNSQPLESEVKLEFTISIF